LYINRLTEAPIIVGASVCPRGSSAEMPDEMVVIENFTGGSR
jgi:hypothetical protein